MILKLTQEQAVQVAIGEINNWCKVGCDAIENDLGVPFWMVQVRLHHLQNSMKAFSKKWKLGVSSMPTGIGNKGNAGVAGNIRTQVVLLVMLISPTLKMIQHCCTTE